MAHCYYHRVGGDVHHYYVEELEADAERGDCDYLVVGLVLNYGIGEWEGEGERTYVESTASDGEGLE